MCIFYYQIDSCMLLSWNELKGVYRGYEPYKHEMGKSFVSFLERFLDFP